MATLTDKSYLQADLIKAGMHKLAPVHQEFVDWIVKEFSVNALDFTCEMKESSKGSKRQVLTVMVERAEDAQSLQSNRTNSESIAKRFMSYISSNDEVIRNTDPLKSNIFPVDTNPFPDVHVIYRPLKAINNELTKDIRREECQKVLDKYKDVWTMSQTVIFYYTEAQFVENRNNGISDKIANELLQVMKKYGEPDRLASSPLTFYFDSKEVFDRDFDGKWHYYWK